MYGSFYALFTPTPSAPVDMSVPLDTFGRFVSSAITTALPYAVGIFGAFAAWKIMLRAIRTGVSSGGSGWGGGSGGFERDTSEQDSWDTSGWTDADWDAAQRDGYG